MSAAREGYNFNPMVSKEEEEEEEADRAASEGGDDAARSMPEAYAAKPRRDFIQAYAAAAVVGDEEDYNDDDPHQHAGRGSGGGGGGRGGGGRTSLDESSRHGLVAPTSATTDYYRRRREENDRLRNRKLEYAKRFFSGCIAALILLFVIGELATPSSKKQKKPKESSTNGNAGDLSSSSSSSSELSSLKLFKLDNGTISFGSCTAYDMRDISIFTDAIMPADPDAWIWAGDFVYLDDPFLDCNYKPPYRFLVENHELHPTTSLSSSTSSSSSASNSFEQLTSSVIRTPRDAVWQAACNCTPDFIHTPPYSCMSGDVDHALARWNTALTNEPYNTFLDHMCPMARSLGIFPPRGSDSTNCMHPIVGIYDDHDYGWNNGNQRLPHKSVFKEMYLDAVGEPRESIRRGATRGAWTKYRFNEGLAPGIAVDVFLLDERYDREPLPCDTRRDYCEVALADQSAAYDHDRAWCYDFLKGGNVGDGTCCDWDEKIFYGWCRQENNVNSPYYREACDVSYEAFGHRSLVLDTEGNLRLPQEVNSHVDLNQRSPFCDVLGREQRRWLRKEVSASDAAVKIFVSGSVLLGNPAPDKCAEVGSRDVLCRCSGDNIDCYSVAQKELFYIMTTASGCPVVLTGDYHWSDIKMMNLSVPLSSGTASSTSTPATAPLYASYYGPSTDPVSGAPLYNYPQPLYQLMASGMTTSTGGNFTCESFRRDPLKLRTHPECAFVRGPSYGRVKFDYVLQDDVKAALSQNTLSVTPALEACVAAAQAGLPVSASCAGGIAKIRLQVLGGRKLEDVRLETVIDPSTCHHN